MNEEQLQEMSKTTDAEYESLIKAQNALFHGTQAESDTTDVTDVDHEMTHEAASKLFRLRRRQLQLRDISEMTTRPGDGEYYGPKTYMSSIEIKTFLFNLLSKYWEESEWTDDKMVSYIERFFSFYHELLKEKQMMKHFFFDNFVCTPVTDQQRAEALQMFNTMIRDKNDIISSTKTFDDIMKPKENIKRKVRQDRDSPASDDDAGDNERRRRKSRTRNSSARGRVRTTLPRASPATRKPTSDVSAFDFDEFFETLE